MLFCNIALSILLHYPIAILFLGRLSHNSTLSHDLIGLRQTFRSDGVDLTLSSKVVI